MGATELGPVFHDKVTGQVLDCVRQHHETLVRGSSREDFVTECIWSKILDFMFKKVSECASRRLSWIII